MQMVFWQLGGRSFEIQISSFQKIGVNYDLCVKRRQSRQQFWSQCDEEIYQDDINFF